MTETLQQKIDAIFHKQYFRPEKQELDKALQEFREQIESLQTHIYKVGNDFFVGISFFRVMELLGEKK